MATHETAKPKSPGGATSTATAGWRDEPHATVVIGGGAPNSPLMAGALAEIYDQGKTFNHFYTSGAGGLIGLLFVAPAGDVPSSTALEAVVASSISDEIYRWVPIGYKTFFKPGPFTVPMQRFAKLFKFAAVSPLREDDRLKRLYNDWVDLWAAVLTPTWLSYFSKGVCPPYPFTKEIVDFDKLRRFKGSFQLNAYNLKTGRAEQFRKRELSEPEFAAAFAFPFVYQPVAINGVHYSEGADHDPLNLPGVHRFLRSLVEDRPELAKKVGTFPIENHTVVLLDVLGSMADALVRVPRNLLDAYGVQIMTPVVSLANLVKEKFLRETAGLDYEFVELKFDIPPEHLPYTTEWSHHNMKLLWQKGRQAGKEFLEKHRDKLPNRDPDGPSPLHAHPYFHRADRKERRSG